LDKKAVGIFNICSGQAVTINQIVCQTAEILQRTDLHLTIHKDSQPSRLVGSNQKLIKTIRYKPKTDLRALIPEMVK
jgi:nucleoside-diphosphate-sugar epimerase